MTDRRRFLAGVGAGVAVSVGAGGAQADAAKLRAVVIGHTGRGNYGHGVDLIFAGREGIEVVAVADPDEAGRAKAVARVGAARGYADYREMLEKERPQLVAVGPRQTPERRAMLLAALSAGAHVFSEKPFVRSPADGDEVLAQAAKRNLRIAVAHQMRIAPSVAHLKRRVDEGLLGDLIEMRAFGKQEKRRAGGEDLVVLGVHLFDLMRLFAGDPRWCTALVTEKGREATLADARAASEDVGPVLGDEITAQFAFDRGVTATFTSRAALEAYSGHWGVELVGTKGVARILTDIWPRVLVRPSGKWEDATRTDAWRPLEGDTSAGAPAADRSTALANARVVDDWLAAIRENREPACGGRNAAWAVEMVCGVWRAGLTGGRVRFPLEQRDHPLEAARS